MSAGTHHGSYQTEQDKDYASQRELKKANRAWLEARVLLLHAQGDMNGVDIAASVGATKSVVLRILKQAGKTLKRGP